LPSKPKRDSEGNWTFEKCAGGLVSCLSGVKGHFDMVWLGWIGTEIAESDREAIVTEAMKQNCYPVFLPGDLIEGYYNGFANNVLWPLFHYIMPPFDKGINECSTAQWEAYKKANEMFVEAILHVYEDDDYVWIHDYHLMLVPKPLRNAKPDCNIGWFLHTPFPSAEIYRTLPWRQEIIESLLHANLLGFHVYDYLRHFLSSCVQLTSLEISAQRVDATSIGGCIVTCATMPVGICPQDFTDALDSPEVQLQIETLKEQYGDRKVILGIDRLDYMKGIPHKLMAFGTFLDQHPEWASSCVLVQLAVPSRRDVPEYQRLQRQVHELVGQICGKHSKIESGVPVIYMDASMPFSDLVALYSFADVALITSLRDGMNLVSYEYVASHKNRDPPGVLIISEFAGAAQSLGAGAIRVNPWNLQDTAKAIYDALEMAPEDRTALHNFAYQYVMVHTSQRWAETFVQSLQEACSDLMEVTASVPPLLPYEDLLTEWSVSTKQLIVVDLLECLVPAKKRLQRNERWRSMMVHLPGELRECLLKLAKNPDTTVIVTTDKSRRSLQEIVGHLPVFCAAEGCCVYRRPGEAHWIPLVEDVQSSGGEEWMEGVLDVFAYFRERTPGSCVEKQEYQYRWYWDKTQFDFGSAQAREVLIHLWAGPLVNSEAEVVVGDRSITVRPHACSRSACLERLLRRELRDSELRQMDFALCFAVVSHRDEDVFETLQKLLSLDDEHEEVDWPTLREDSDSEASTVQHSPRLALDSALHTPPELPPPVQPGELPPPYDWVPIAQQEHGEQHFSEGLDVLPELLNPQQAMPDSPMPVDISDRANDCACFTLSLGMKKTKAQHTLPHPYHVQNLLCAMASRLPQGET